MGKGISYYLNKNKSHAATLAFFRVAFGSLMFFSVIRFWSKGWIESLYIKPNFHFKYFGFEWVQDFGN
ncbi:HTTM domain-containing protein, partial [Bacteroidetes bacterium SCGC AAA795-G10]